AVDLGGATFNPTAGVGFALPAASPLVLIDNDGTDPVTGQFAGLPEGANLVVGGLTVTVSYRGGDGNDVILTTAPIVASVDVNGGAVQRSRVTQLAVTFSTIVDPVPLAAAFTLTLAGGGSVGTVAVSSAV